MSKNTHDIYDPAVRDLAAASYQNSIREGKGDFPQPDAVETISLQKGWLEQKIDTLKSSALSAVEKWVNQSPSLAEDMHSR